MMARKAEEEKPEWLKGKSGENEALDWEDAETLKALNEENQAARATRQKKLAEVM